MKKNNRLSETMEELYTPKEVAEYLSVKLSTVYNWVKISKIEAHVLSQGKRKSTVRFDKEQIRRFIETRDGGAR